MGKTVIQSTTAEAMADKKDSLSTCEHAQAGWREMKLGEITDIGSSKRIFYKEYVDKGVPFYRSKEIIEKYNRKKISTKLYISNEKFLEIKRKFGVPNTGDILLTSVGTLGIPYIVEPDETFYFKDGNLIWFKNFSGDILNYFLYYWIVSPVGKGELRNATIGSTQPALTIQNLHNLKLNVPPLHEQKAIAEILSSLDDKIDLLHHQNKTLENMAQALFRKWFMEETNKNWEEKPLGEVTDIAIGRTPPREEFQWFSKDPEDWKWISIKDMGGSGVYIFDTSENLTQKAVDKFNIPVIPENTVVLSFKMTVGRIKITTVEMLSNEAIAHFKFNHQTPFSREYLYFYLKTFKFDSLGSTSSIVTSINSTMIKEMLIEIPDYKSMSKFQKTSEPLFKKIYSNMFQIRTLENIRDALLPKLISGKVKARF